MTSVYIIYVLYPVAYITDSHTSLCFTRISVNPLVTPLNQTVNKNQHLDTYLHIYV